MNKILHISKYYYPFLGGTEQIVRDCVLALKGRYEQKVIAFNDSQGDEKSTVDDIEVLKCGTFAKISSQSLSASYKKILNFELSEYRPDIIIFHYPNPFVATLLLKALRKDDAKRALESKPQTKLIVYWHLDIIRQKFLSKFFVQQNQRLLSRADKIIATSPNYITGSRWLKAFEDKCVVVPNCINVERMQLTPEIEARTTEIKRENRGKIICVAIGRHTEYKGFTYLIQASKMLDDHFRIFITGTGELTDRLHKESEDDPKIIFTGALDDGELKALLNACDIFCFPSVTKNEAFGLALAEAMYYGKPAVTFTIPGSGVNYVCINEEDGIEVENRNVKAYAEALKKLALDENLRERYGSAGRQRVVENFLSPRFCENIRQVVDNCTIVGELMS